MRIVQKLAVLFRTVSFLSGFFLYISSVYGISNDSSGINNDYHFFRNTFFRELTFPGYDPEIFNLTGTKYSFTFMGADGEYHLPLEAKNYGISSFITGGGITKRSLRLTGLFGISYSLKNDILFVHNNNPYNGVPFLFADSTRGGFDQKGIFMQASLSFSTGQFYRFGISAFYSVDKEIKSVFPKSFIDRRFITSGIFLERKTGKSKAEMHLLYSDDLNQYITTRYSLEQNKTPVFIKIRGLDTPVVSYGQTSEERNQQVNGLFQMIRWEKTVSSFSILSFHCANAYHRGIIRDDFNLFINQGNWDEFTSSIVGTFRTQLRMGLSLLLGFEGNYKNIKAFHPDIELQIYQYKFKELGGFFGFTKPIGKELGLGGKIFYSGKMQKRTDFYNGILDYFPFRDAGFSFRLTKRWINGKTSSLVICTSREFSGKESVFTERTGWYFNEIVIPEEKYLSEDKYLGFILLRHQGFGKVSRGFEIKLDWISPAIKPDTKRLNFYLSIFQILS